jgi:hypothetical protein
MPRGVYDRTKKTKGAPASAKKSSSKKNGHHHPEVLKLDELTLYKMRCFDAEMKSLQSEVLIQKGVKEGLLAKADPTGVLKKLDEKVQLLTANYHQKAQEYKALRDEVGERMGIDMKDYAYDDTTGVLHDLSAAPPESLPTEKSKTVQ